MSEGPKLYTNRPKKAQVKQFLQQQQMKGTGLSASSSPMGAQSSPPPPPQPKESFVRRYKFMWPLLLTVNLAVGAYIFMRTRKKDTGIEEEVAAAVVTTPVSTTAATTAPAPVIEKPLPSPPIMAPVKLPDPIPENQQREIFKWLLEEKRKVKPNNPEEKKRIDEEKAILKQFIRATSIPTF
ncbi:uncharacterized protein LOC117921481 [Vitis riparia]|uniref:uncharacterized protein LOC117921481 n=1 Tax=Vitis riparia TaxID=96939 RepID=UPI00155A6048|nr:uncharacterized protein LOC117921481 [Vitis riparia]